MPHGRRRDSKGSGRSALSKQPTASHEQVQQTQDSVPLEIHAIATPLTGSRVEDRSRHKLLTASREQVEQRTQDSLPLDIHPIATPFTGSHVEDHSRHTAATPGTSNSPEELCGSQWSSRLRSAFQLPHNMRVELLSLLDKDTSAVQPAARDIPVSAQMNSFWSMWAHHSGGLLPKW